MTEMLAPEHTEAPNHCLDKYDNQNTRFQRLLRAGKVLIGYSVFVASYNTYMHYDTFAVQANVDDIDMIEDAELCPPFDHVEVEPETGRVIIPEGFTAEQAEITIETQNKFSQVKSAASRLKPDGYRPNKFIQQLIEANVNEVASFTSKYSGAEFRIVSDSKDPNFDLDTEAIDKLLHASLDENLVFEHIAVSQFMECARDKILLSRGGSLLDGHRINLFIAGENGVCFSNMHIQRFPRDDNVRYKDFCDSIGATYKDLRFDLVPGIFGYKQSWIAVMTHRHIIKDANRIINIMLMHEFIHMIQQALGLPFKYNPNERLADYIEEEVMNQLFSDYMPWGVGYREE